MKTEIIGIVSIIVQEADESFVCVIADELYNMPGKKTTQRCFEVHGKVV